MARSRVISATSGASSRGARAGTTLTRQLTTATRTLDTCDTALHARCDAAAVHAYRVALRSLFRLALPLFSPADAARFRAAFAWLSARRSPVRDLDVLHKSLPTYLDPRICYSVRLATTLQPVLATFRARCAADLLSALTCARHREL
jgi:CHAD domain-containing protein